MSGTKQKTIFTRNELISPVEIGDEFNGYFTRRKKTKKGYLQYYLYSIDSENLILSGILENQKSFEISLSALDFSQDSKNFVSTSIIQKQSCVFLDKHKRPFLNIETHPVGEKAKICKGVTVRFYNKEGELINSPESDLISQREPQLEGDVYVLRFPKFAGISSEKNIILDYKGQYCFVFEKMEKDEFYIAVRYPLSITQGFAIALTIMRKGSH